MPWTVPGELPMILITNSDDEYASALSALQVINSLRGNPTTEAPNLGDHRGQWTRNVWANPKYL